MKNKLNIGVIIADDNEYEAAAAVARKLGGEPCDFYRKSGYKLSLSDNSRSCEITMVYSRVGKVNAAESAALMAVSGLDYILSAGLSGGISGVRLGQLCVGTKFIEHDFDLTPLGFEKAVKPSQEYIYSADPRLVRLFTENLPDISAGCAVTGDCFICDDALRREMLEKYSAATCDMESAAIASVCHNFGIGFTTLRKVSDDAGDDSAGLYNNSKNSIEASLIESFFDALGHIFFADDIWN